MEAASDECRFSYLQLQKADLVVLAAAEKERCPVLEELLSLVFSVMLNRNQKYKADSGGEKKVINRSTH